MAHPSSFPGFFPTRPRLSLLRNEVDGDKFGVQVSFVTPPHPSNPYNVPHSSLECLNLSLQPILQPIKAHFKAVSDMSR